MKRFALAAMLAFATAACTTDPTEPAPSLGKTKKGTTSPALICDAQRTYVEALTRRVDYLTTGEVRTSLLAPLGTAHVALDPAACQPAVAIAALEEFIALVDKYEAEGAISPSLAKYFRSTANYVISNLRPLV